MHTNKDIQTSWINMEGLTLRASLGSQSEGILNSLRACLSKDMLLVIVH